MQKTSLIDFPGRVAAVVFTQGCNMRCPYCHNPSLVLPGKFEEPLDEAALFEFLERRKGRLDGVVISGGEPTVHRDLPDFIRRVRALGFDVKLDTNGSNPAMLAAMLAVDLLDYVAMDLKGDPGRYADFCGAAIPEASIRASVDMIIHSGVDHEFRTTAVPGMHTLEGLKALADLVQGADRYAVQVFRPGTCLNPDYCALAPYDMSEVSAAKAYFQARVKVFELRGAPEGM
ncbi:MAG: anaerobic ribonucleoside-triphosphate reductase activating protein [Opitutales bacterium]